MLLDPTGESVGRPVVVDFGLDERGLARSDSSLVSEFLPESGAPTLKRTLSRTWLERRMREAEELGLNEIPSCDLPVPTSSDARVCLDRGSPRACLECETERKELVGTLMGTFPLSSRPLPRASFEVEGELRSGCPQ